MARNIKLFSILNFFTDLKFHSAVLVIYFTHVTGSFTLAMSLFSIVMISCAVFEVPTGIYSDLIGRKRTIIAGAISATLSAIFYATGHNYIWLFVGAIFDGLSQAWYSGNNEAYLYDVLADNKKSDRYAHYLGKTSAMFQLALMIGAVIGSVIAQWSFSFIMWLSVIPQACCIFVAVLLPNVKKYSKEKANVYSHLKNATNFLWKNKHLRLLSLQEILRFGAGESSFVFNSAFIQTLWPIWAIGLSRLMTFGGAFASYWFSSKIIKKIGEYNSIITANLSTRAMNLLAYGSPTIFSPILMGTTSLTYGISMVSNSSLMQKEFSNAERATLGSVTSLFGKLFYGIFSIVMGFSADLIGPAKTLVMVQVFMLGVLIIQIRVKQTAPDKINV